MNPRALDKRVTIQQCAITKGASSGKVKTWSDVDTVWAALRPLSGNERRITDHGGQAAEASTEFIIRYLDGTDESMRVSYKGKYYNIRHVKNINEGNRWMVLACDTGVNDG